MKPVTATVVFGLFVSIASGQGNSPVPGKRFSLEALSRQHEARVTWSMEVGHLESAGCRAVVTALVVENSSHEHQRIRGVRIDFSQPGWKSTVYVDEGLLQPLKRIFDQLNLSVELARSSRESGPHFIGACEFRNPDLYPLTADFSLKESALRVNGVIFAGLMPADLSKILNNAIDELKTR